MSHSSAPQPFESRVYDLVAAIPPGFVATYGDLARAAGKPRGARQVGRALGATPPELGLPWHRVVNSAGRISLPAGSPGARAQVRRLRAEGVQVRDGKIAGFAGHRFYPSAIG